MARDEEEDDFPKRKKKSSVSGSVVLIVAVLFFGLIIGALVEHFYIEPLLAPITVDQLNSCLASKSLLDLENQNCLRQLYGSNAVPSDGNNPV